MFLPACVRMALAVITNETSVLHEQEGSECHGTDSSTKQQRLLYKSAMQSARHAGPHADCDSNKCFEKRSEMYSVGAEQARLKVSSRKRGQTFARQKARETAESHPVSIGFRLRVRLEHGLNGAQSLQPL
jgi:hypothetical protein